MKPGAFVIVILFVGCGGRVTGSDGSQDRDAGWVQPPVDDASPGAAVDAAVGAMDVVTATVDAVAP